MLFKQSKELTTISERMIEDQKVISYTQEQMKNCFITLKPLMSRAPKGKKKSTFGSDLNCFLFGRNLDDAASAAEETEISGQGTSFFERVLMSRESRHFIELIWDKMDLNTRKEIMNMVRILFSV